jgi:hypothetical protein
MIDGPEVWDEVLGMYIGDGDLNFVLYFSTQELAASALDPTDTEAALTGETSGWIEIEGTDSIRILIKGSY